jgi:hypothetical protein
MGTRRTILATVATIPLSLGGVAGLSGTADATATLVVPQIVRLPSPDTVTAGGSVFNAKVAGRCDRALRRGDIYLDVAVTQTINGRVFTSEDSVNLRFCTGAVQNWLVHVTQQSGEPAWVAGRASVRATLYDFFNNKSDVRRAIVRVVRH